MNAQVNKWFISQHPQLQGYYCLITEVDGSHVHFVMYDGAKFLDDAKMVSHPTYRAIMPESVNAPMSVIMPVKGMVATITHEGEEVDVIVGDFKNGRYVCTAVDGSYRYKLTITKFVKFGSVAKSNVIHKKGDFVANKSGKVLRVIGVRGDNVKCAEVLSLTNWIEHNGPHSLFDAHEPLVLDNSGIMDAYTIKKFKHHKGMSQETECFECEVAKNGKVFAHVRNDGWGGSNSVHGCGNKGDLALIAQFAKDAEAWFRHYGKEPFEAMDMWINYMTMHVPHGMTAEMFCK